MSDGLPTGAAEAAVAGAVDGGRRRSPGTWLKPVAVALLVGGVVLAVPATPLGKYLNYEEFQGLVGSSGLLAPILFVAVLTIGSVFLAPASLIAFAGAAVFEPLLAMILVVVGANLGATSAFLVGRWAGRDLVEGRLARSRGWYARMDQALVQNGLMAVLFLRVIFAPFNLLNYVAAFTHLRYRDYAIGTFFGMLPVIFVWVFLGDVLGQVWQTGDLRPLWSPSSVVAGAVFLVCIGVPLLVRRLRRRPA